MRCAKPEINSWREAYFESRASRAAADTMQSITPYREPKSDGWEGWDEGWDVDSQVLQAPNPKVGGAWKSQPLFER